MTDKERLEEVRQNVNWLIEQVEIGKQWESVALDRFNDWEKSERENKKLREALEFYADPTNYDYKIVVNPGRNNRYKEISSDEGYIARKALEDNQ